MSLPYKKENILLAKILRKNMTRWEQKLWYEFLANYPVRFQRQKAIGSYIADFYCHDAALLIELDGKHHFLDTETETNDLIRQEELSKQGLLVLRFVNSEIDRRFSFVCKSIDRAVTERVSKIQV